MWFSLGNKASSAASVLSRAPNWNCRSLNYYHQEERKFYSKLFSRSYSKLILKLFSEDCKKPIAEMWFHVLPFSIVPSIFNTHGGLPKPPKLSSGGWIPCSTGIPHYVSVLGTHLYQCANWYVMRGCVWLQWIFFENSFNVFAQFMMGDLWVHLPTLCWVFSSFWSKTAWFLCPTLPIHLISPCATFFVCLGEESPQRETFCHCGIGETRNSRSTKRHQNWWV